MPGFAQLSQESAASLGHFIYPGLGITHCSQSSFLVLFISWFRFENHWKILKSLFQMKNYSESRVWNLSFPSFSVFHWIFSSFLFSWLLCEFGCHPEPCADLKLVTGFWLLWGQSRVWSFGRDRFPIPSPDTNPKANPISSSLLAPGMSFWISSKPPWSCCQSSGRFWAALLPPALLVWAGRAPCPFGSQVLWDDVMSLCHWGTGCALRENPGRPDLNWAQFQSSSGRGWRVRVGCGRGEHCFPDKLPWLSSSWSLWSSQGCREPGKWEIRAVLLLF